MGNLIKHFPALLALALLGAAAAPATAQPNRLAARAGGMVAPGIGIGPGVMAGTRVLMMPYGGMGYYGRGYYGRGYYGMGGYNMGGYGMGNYDTGNYGTGGYGMAVPDYSQYGQATITSQGSETRQNPFAALGLFGDQDGLEWPLGLRIMTPWPESRGVRDQLDGLLRQVAKQAESGSVDPKVADLAGRKVRRLRRMLDDADTRIPSRTADASRRFLNDLEEALQLYQPSE